MSVRGILLVALLLMASAAVAKKLYKYQDEQGRWYFSDKPPVTEQKVEVRQLKPSTKKRVKLEKSGSDSHPDFYLMNQYPGPIEVEIDWDERNNANASLELPHRFVVEPGKSADLFSISGADPALAWRVSLQYRYVIGRPLPDYVGQADYLPPIAPGSRFQITQAFEGRFSHTDDQNRYAVDIMMPIGTPIYAARAGIVLEVEDDYYSGGTQQAYVSKANSIYILHDDGSMAVYAHLELEKALVYPGLQVRVGELIGYSGNTGFSSGPHLHFVVQVNRGMKLESVPFKFIDAGHRLFVPQEGAWLLGVNPGP